MKYRNYIILVLFCIVTFFSCQKETGSASWDISVFSPIIHSTLNVDNLVPDSLLQQNADSSLKIVYDNTLYRVSLASLVNAPDTIIYQVYNVPFNLTGQPNMQIVNKFNKNSLNFGSAKISKIIVKSGSLVFRIQNKIKEKILSIYQIPCATLNGQVFETTDIIPAATHTSAAYFTKKVDISGYTFNLTGATGNSANILLTQANTYIDPNGKPVDVNIQDSLILFVGFENLQIEYAKGYFGSSSTMSGEQLSNFTPFNKIIDGTLKVEDMKVNLFVSNGFGIDAGFRVNEVKSINTKTNKSVSLNSSFVGTNVNINRALETSDVLKPVVPYKYAVNLSNSNFKQLLENLPDQFGFNMDINSNPLGNISCGNDFAYNSYAFEAGINIEIPLSLMANNLTLKDTINYSISQPQGYKINHGQLKIIANNGFPFSASIQVLLYDPANMLTMGLIQPDNIIEAASVDVSNKVNSTKISTINIPISGDKLEHFYTAKKMIIVARFNTANAGQYMKIYSNYNLDIKITGDWEMNVNQQ